MSTRLQTVEDGDGTWYHKGVRFECTGSGKCCTVHGAYAFVFMTRAEDGAIADHLVLTRRRFRQLHTTRTSSGDRSLRFPDGRCTFLNGNRCSIYEVRPGQCRTWPFWSENMDAGVWNEDIASFCPGVGRGRLYAREEIEAVMDGQADVGE
jgi:Fe-S-cluster containining protein